jgi:hypothetical protein
VSDPKNRERLERVYDAVEASLDDMTGEELREQVRALAEDPDEVVEDVRNLFARIKKEHRQAKLREAQAGHRTAIQAYRTRTTRIPSNPIAQRAMIALVAQLHPQQFTMQHRELEAMPSEELVEVLKQLDALGLLPGDET